MILGHSLKKRSTAWCGVLLFTLGLAAPSVHALAPASRIDEIRLQIAIEDIKRSLDQPEDVLREKLETLFATPGWSEVLEDFLLFLQRGRPSTDPAIATLASIVRGGEERAVALRDLLLALISANGAAQFTARTILIKGGMRLFDPEDPEEIAARQFVLGNDELSTWIEPYQDLTDRYGYALWKSLYHSQSDDWVRTSAKLILTERIPGMRIAFGEQFLILWPDMVALGKEGGGLVASSLFDSGFITLRNAFGEELPIYWPDMVALGMVAEENMYDLLSFSFDDLRETFGEEFSSYWPDLVDLGKAVGKEAKSLFSAALPSVRRLFRTREGLRRVGADLVVLGKAAGDQAGALFGEGLPAVCEAFHNELSSAWPDVKRTLLALLDQTTDFNRARILELLLDKEYLLWLRGQQADLLEHVAFYTQVLSREPRLGYQILEGIAEGLKTGVVPIALPTQEKELIFDFVGKLHTFSPSLYTLYKKHGDEGLKVPFAFARKILTDEVAAVDVKALKDDFDRQGLDGLGILASTIQIAIPSSGASFVKRAEIRGLLEKYIEQGDLRGHIPDVLRDKDFGGGPADTIRFNEWYLAEEMEFDPKKRIAGLLDALRYRDQGLSAGEADKRKQGDREALKKTLEEYLKEKVSKQDVLERFYAYVAHSDQLGEKIDRITPDEYQGLNLLEELFLDKDNLSILFKEVTKEVFEADPKAVPRVSRVGEGQPVQRGMVKQIEGLWASGLTPDKKLERLATMLERTTAEQITEDLIPKLSDASLISAILEITQRPDRSRPQRPIELIEELFSEPIGWVRSEKEKFEERESDREVELEFRVVKGIPYGLWGLCAGVCIATDLELWKKPEFMLLAMIDQQSGKTVGFVHLFEAEVKGKRVLTVPGIEPSVEFISEVKAREVFPLIEKALVKVAEEGGYEAMYLPRDPNILSNRTEIIKEARRRYGEKEDELDTAIAWNKLPNPYPFTEVYEMWKKEAPVPGPQDLERELAEEEAVGLHALAPSSSIDALDRRGQLNPALIRRLERRDQQIELELEKLRDPALNRNERLNAAHFLNQYLVPTQGGAEKLVPAMTQLQGELIALAARLRKDPDIALQKAFLQHLDVIRTLAVPQTPKILMRFLEDDRAMDLPSGLVTRVMAQSFRRGWPHEYFDEELIERMQNYLARVVSRTSIRRVQDDKNYAGVIFHNLSRMWGETRNEELLDFYIDVVEKDRWRPFTQIAAHALKESWLMFDRRGKTPKAQGWVDRLKAVALDENRSSITRAFAIEALAGVKEEAAGVEAIAQILRHRKTGAFLRMKALEVVFLYSKRGNLSTLSLAGKISAQQLHVLMKHVATVLRAPNARSQVGVGIQVLKDQEALNVIDLAELHGQLLSVAIRDGHTQGRTWDAIEADVELVNTRLVGDWFAGKQPMLHLLTETAYDITPLEPHLDEKSQAAPTPAPEALVAIEHRVEAFSLHEYYGVSSAFSQKMRTSHDAHKSFFWGLFQDLSFVEFIETDFVRGTPMGASLAEDIRKDMGDISPEDRPEGVENFLENILPVELMALAHSRGQQEYSLESWNAVLNAYRAFVKKKGIEKNPYAHLLWQRTMLNFLWSVFLDEWDVDSPASRRYTRIKLLHRTEIIPKEIYMSTFPNTGAVTVDDRWMVFPDVLFHGALTLGWDATTATHEAQHWLRGSDDIGMLGAAVLFGLDHELRFLVATLQASPRPLGAILEKLDKGTALGSEEDRLVGQGFREGARLLRNETIRGPKAALLEIFHNFTWPVHDWPWEDIVAARQLIFTEIVTKFTVSGKEYEETNTYNEGQKLAGYLMALAARSGVAEGWQIMGELLAKQPEKYKGKNKRRINPAEAQLVMEVMGGMAGEGFREQLETTVDGISGILIQHMGSRDVPEEEEGLLRRRVAKRLEDFIKRDAMDIEMDEDASYDEIHARSREIVAEFQEKLTRPAEQGRIALSVLNDLQHSRPAPFLMPLWRRLEADVALGVAL